MWLYSIVQVIWISEQWEDSLVDWHNVEHGVVLMNSIE
jgi:hypothetical protein